MMVSLIFIELSPFPLASKVTNLIKIFSLQAVQGSLEMGDRFQRQAAELENALKVASRTF
jgi:hypothetical protein